MTSRRQKLTKKKKSECEYVLEINITDGCLSAARKRAANIGPNKKKISKSILSFFTDSSRASPQEHRKKPMQAATERERLREQRTPRRESKESKEAKLCEQIA